MSDDIKKLINLLSGEDGIARQKARHQLVEIGEPAIDYLIELQYSSNHQARWEAIKAIGQIGSDEAIPVLINSLEDSKFDVRWLAAEGLIEIGKSAIKPVVNAFLENHDSAFIKEGLHHVLKEMKREGKFADQYDLINSLEDTYEEEKAIIASEKTVNSL